MEDKVINEPQAQVNNAEATEASTSKKICGMNQSTAKKVGLWTGAAIVLTGTGWWLYKKFFGKKKAEENKAEAAQAPANDAENK